MGNTTSLLEGALEVIAPRKRTRSEEKENLMTPQRMLRTGSVRRSIVRHLGQAKEEKHELPPRRIKSLDYLREPHPHRGVMVNGGLGDDDSDTDSVRPRVPNPSMPHGNDEGSVPTSKAHTGLCDTCLGINIETTTADNGYWHLLVSELYGSGSNCELCRSIKLELGLNWNKIYSGDRYRIVVSLEPQDEPIVVSQSISGHYDASSIPWLKTPIPRLLRVAITDCRPWEDPDLSPFLYSWADQPREYTVPAGSKPEVVISTNLPVLTNEHDPATEVGIGWVREIGQGTASSRSFEIAADWLNACLSCESVPRKTMWQSPNEESGARHPSVELEHAWTLQEVTVNATRADSLPEEMPSRLIEVRPNPEREGMIRLVETNEVADTTDGSIRFAALSYCWGQPLPGDAAFDWRTTKARLGTHLTGLTRSALPQTLRDGITIAEKLNIPYIWIDALCIVQDDEDDWAREAAKMSGIYLGSVLTIAVSSSASMDEGCFGSQSQLTVKSGKFHESWVTVDGMLSNGRRSCLYISTNRNIAVDLDMYRDQVLGGPLSTRAWTLQEQVLPRRTLYYTSKQLMWKCTHCVTNEENFPQPQHQELYPILDFDFPLGPEAIETLWYQGVVERYSKRHLTFGSDKLVAISALARATYLNRHVDYVAGLWKDCILSGTLWQRNSPGCKNETYACPSWSWASQDSSVSYFWARDRPCDDAPRCFTPRVMDVQWKPDAAANPFGNVTSACIYLDTRIKLGIVARDFSLATKSQQSREGDLSQSLVFSEPDSTKPWHATAIMDEEGTAGGAVTMAAMLGPRADQPVFLLLLPADLNADEYRRVGIARLDSYHSSAYPKLKGNKKDMTSD